MLRSTIHREFLGVWFCFLAACSSPAATYWVATYGSDSNAGTSSNAPFLTPQKAVTLSGLAAGDTIYVRGGNYAFSAQVKPSKTGAAGNPVKLWAYPGEFPVWDFATMPAGTTKALDSRKDYWHIKGIEVKNAPDSGILIAGFGTIIEGCTVHDCGNDGFIFGSTSIRATNALILNCDSYRNYGGGDGNNGDGFGAKTGCGPGNVFRGCRAWNNSDDGWDCYDNVTNSIVFQECWSFANGYNLWGYTGTWSGNGNGFKLGGESTSATHYVTNCVTFGNRAKGFDHNNSHGGHVVVNCTGYSNNAANFSFYQTPSNGTYNLMVNNASFVGTLFNLDPTTVQKTNSWQGFTVTAADFASLDTSAATNARATDFSLATGNLFRLAAGSDLIDRAVNVGLPFSGSGPDLGAFEYSVGSAQGPITLSSPRWTNGLFQLTVSGLTSHGEVVVLASSNLSSWTGIFTNPATSGAWQFTDSNAPASATKFYRVWEQ
ncbi:MAG: right-handed parallel beta-helix repeat-containing protein [Verrucomicrobia bacterium]|nr:MAG: right-handed parallel beta-helix repeat-containing protein [Verrucomicrobiota bacterium]